MNSLEILVKSSFFDTISTNSNEKSIVQGLWLTLNEFEEQYGISFNKITKGKILFSGIMCKQDQNQEVKEYFFQLFDQFLVQLKADKIEQRIIAIMPLHFVRLEFQDDIQETDEELPFFLLTKNKQFDILVPDTQKNFKIWLNLFRPRCVLSYYGQFYENIRIIGKGSFAKVMLCIRQEDQKEFAVKIYDKKKISNSISSNQTKLGIQNEIKILQSLDHKNIIKLHEIYEGQQHIYLIFELLKGGELFNKLQTQDNYSEKDAYPLMQNIFQAMDYLHSKGIMHRDIKPENLILRNNESSTEIVLADFGLSELYVKDQSQLLFKRCGTPGYVAPELLNNLPYDTQVDVFSTGIIFYIILTGYAPFFGDTYDQILQKNKKCQICFDFHKIDINLSPEATDLLKQMLNPNPKKRITIKQALQHPWMKLFQANQQSSNEEQKLQYKTENIQKIHSIIKQTRQQDLTESNCMIMRSPIINGNTVEIKSPFNADSPEVLQYTPVEKQKKMNFSQALHSAGNSKNNQKQLKKLK